ncbi:MAG TPA: fused MFS/spermidine synthase [Prosthecobacter sp.]|nr:fused MFS/spermidine synthase [Prosthecobacter sp.]
MSRSSTVSSILLLSSLSLLSAFLLFQVQPVLSKFILPWFGGSPGVWTTCMLFFQVVLFAGYAYAHLLTRLRPRYQGIIHCVLVLVALFFLPIAPSSEWKPTGLEDPSFRILLLLLGTVGLPYFVLSSTSPLTQVWFTRAVPGGRPWRLYALSNLGSLAALLTYPFFFEVHWDVTKQTWIWSAAFLVFAALSITIALKDRRRLPVVPESAEPEAAAKVHWWQRLLWVLLPACASAMLLAATNHVCQDVAVVPFMWVVPLSLYLLTFIICFEHERWYVPAAWSLVAMVVLFVAGAGFERSQTFIKLLDLETVEWPQRLEGWVKWLQDVDLDRNFVAELLISFTAMFLACMVCHGELARQKPHHSRLTEFYLLMSAGGALGGLAVSLGAPKYFVSYLEWPLGLVICFIIAAGAFASWALRFHRYWWAMPIIVLLTSAAFASVKPLAKWQLKEEPRTERVRNFYGAIYVDEDEEYNRRTLTHGGIVHGIQILSEGYREEPLTYYGRHTGIGLALESLKNKPDARVGVVGMGTATVACYGQSGHLYRFYEINPEIPRLARKYFTYIEDMEKRGGKVETVVADARLALDREPSQQFDVLLLDAFSGDAIPVHLLTQEAFAIYRKHMKPDGIIAVHCTNTYLALAPVTEKQAEVMGWKTTRVVTDSESDHDITDYVLVTKNEAFLEAHPTEISGREEFKMDPPVWTDQYHNLFQILLPQDDDEK